MISTKTKRQEFSIELDQACWALNRANLEASHADFAGVGVSPFVLESIEMAEKAIAHARALLGKPLPTRSLQPSLN